MLSRASAPRCADTAIVYPRDYHPRNSCHTSRRATRSPLRGASAGACGQGHEVTGTESCHGDGLFSKDPFPANVRLIVRLSSRLPAPRPILPQRYQVWPPALPRQAPWSSQRHTFGASPRPLEAVPSWGTGKFLRTHMTAIPGKVARFHAVCAAPARPCRMSLPLRAIHSGSCSTVTWPAGWQRPASPRAFPSLRRPAGKSFWKGGARGGRTFLEKCFATRRIFSKNFRLLQIFRHPPAVFAA